MTPSKDMMPVELEVPFHDCDPLGVVWHGHYYKYMELARTIFLRNHDLEIRQIQELGFMIFVIETKCRYSSPLFYSNHIRITPQLKDCSNRINIAYEIHNLTTNKRAARGHTILASTDYEGNLLLETPHEIFSRLCRSL